MENTVNTTVEELIKKEATLIEGYIDNGAEHSTEIDNLTKLLEAHRKIVEGDRAHTTNTAKEAVVLRELDDKLITSAEDRANKKRELDIKEGEVETAKSMALSDARDKRHDMIVKSCDVAVKLICGVVGVAVPTTACLLYVDRSLKMEVNNEYQSSPTIRWLANKLRFNY